MQLSEDRVREELKKVIDPELFVNIVDLGLIYVVNILDGPSGDELPAAATDQPAAAEQAASPAQAHPVPPPPPVEAASADAAAPAGQADTPDAAAAEPKPGKRIEIEMTMTSPACPAGPQLIANAKKVVGQLEGVGEVEVRIVMDPPWTPDCMTDDARDQLGIF